MSAKFYVTSDDRTNKLTADASAGSCTINLGKSVQGRYAIVNGYIQNTVYPVTDTTNNIRFTVSSTDCDAKITAGNYTPNSLAAALQTSMQPFAASMTVTYSAVTGKLTFAASPNFTITYSLTTIAPIIGLLADKSSNASQTMDAPINLTYNFNTALIKISECINPNTSLNQDYHVAAIIDEAYGDKVPFNKIEVPSFVEFRANTKQITFVIYNSNGVAVNMNSGGFAFEFREVPGDSKTTTDNKSTALI